MVSCSRWTRSGRAERSRGNLPLAAAWPPSGHRDPSTARGSSAQLRVGAVGVRDAAGADRPAARPQRHRGHRARPPPPTAPGPGGRRHGDGRPLPAASTAVVTRLVAHAGRQAVSARLLHEFTCGGGGGRPVATVVVARRLLHRPGRKVRRLEIDAQRTLRSLLALGCVLITCVSHRHRRANQRRRARFSYVRASWRETSFSSATMSLKRLMSAKFGVSSMTAFPSGEANAACIDNRAHTMGRWDR